MSKPNLRIFLVRHGLSEANMDKTVNARKPDHAIELSPEGHEQARAAGVELAKAIASGWSDERRGSRSTPVRQDRRVRLLVSPYLRTRQTADGLQQALDEVGIRYDRREAMELREIAFGLYDGLEDHELAQVFPREHAHYQKHVDFAGELFAPMPMGESRIQVGDRVKSLFGTILRDATAKPDVGGVRYVERDPLDSGPILDCIVVGHGVTNRQFRHRWMHHPWEWVEAEPNPGNCSIHLIDGGNGGGYREEVLFEGFRHVRGHERQEQREDGHVLPDAG